MPTYEYQCEKCERVFEIRQRITEAPLTACDVCGGRVKRLLSPAPFILKGEGWYVTDYPSEARKKAKEAEKAPSNGSADKTAKAAGDKPATDTAAADKPAASSAAGTSGTSGTTGAAAPSAPAKSD